MHVLMHVCLYVCMHACMHACTYVSMCVTTYVGSYVCVYVFFSVSRLSLGGCGFLALCSCLQAPEQAEPSTQSIPSRKVASGDVNW